MKKIPLKKWIDYLYSRVDIDVYVYGGNGECIVTLFPKLTSMEKSLSDVNRVLTLLNKRLMTKVTDIFLIRGEDCSGLAIKFLLDEKIVESDMTANGLWDYIVGNKEKGIKAHGKRITRKEVKSGDYLWQGNDTNKHHIGYAVNKDYAIESKNHDEGVVLTKIDDRGWKYFARPDWYEDDVYTLTRELYFTEPMMEGGDVKQVQARLNELNYNCGTVDGIFGNKTKIAVANFQTDAKLDIQRLGTVGKKTAKALGFDWSEVDNETNKNS